MEKYLVFESGKNEQICLADFPEKSQAEQWAQNHGAEFGELTIVPLGERVELLRHLYGAAFQRNSGPELGGDVEMMTDRLLDRASYLGVIGERREGIRCIGAGSSETSKVDDSNESVNLTSRLADREIAEK